LSRVTQIEKIIGLFSKHNDVLGKWSYM